MAQRRLPRVEMERSTVEQYQRAILKLEQLTQAETGSSKRKRSSAASSTAPAIPPLEDQFDDIPYASQSLYTDVDLMIFENEQRERTAKEKADENSRKRKQNVFELEADEEEEDPVCKALSEQQNRRSLRNEKTTFEGVFTRPKEAAVGVDYALQDPYDAKFFHNKYCYQVKNLRVRRSRLGNKHYIHLLKLFELPNGEIKPGERYSFPGDILPGIIQVLGELENEIQAYML